MGSFIPDGHRKVIASMNLPSIQITGNKTPAGESDGGHASRAAIGPDPARRISPIDGLHVNGWDAVKANGRLLASANLHRAIGRVGRVHDGGHLIRPEIHLRSGS